MTNKPDASAGGDSEKHPIGSRILHLDYDRGATEAIARLLGAELGLADFRLPSAAVYQLTVPGTDDRPAVLLTLWPSIKRVDAISPAATIVFTQVETVALVPEVEVQFRRSTREYLIVTRGGKVIVRA